MFLMDADPLQSANRHKSNIWTSLLFFFYPEWNRIVLRVIGTTCVDPTISTQNDCWGKDLLKVINAEIQSPEFTSSEGLQVPVPVFSAIRADESNRKDSVMTSAPPWPREKISGPITSKSQAQRVREIGFTWVTHCRLHHADDDLNPFIPAFIV